MRAVVVSHQYADPANRGKLRALAGQGVAVAAAVPARWVPPGGGPPREVSWGDDAGVRIAPIPVQGPAAEPDRGRWNASALRRFLSDFRPALIQVEEEPWTPAAALVTRVARGLGVPVVLATRESLPRRLPVLERLRRERVLGRVRGLLPANRLAAEWVGRTRPALPCTVIPPFGVAPPTLAPRLPHQGLTIGFLGRLVPERGLDLLFRACVGLPGRWSVTVVGTGPSQEELEELAERLGIAARVTWHGALPRSAIAAMWPTLDCVALPSRTTQQWVEVASRAALDAMAHGVAVVASRSGALPEIVGDAGQLVPEDDVPALGAVLQELLADRELCTRLGTLGRRRVMTEFSDAAIARRTLEFWGRVRTATA